MMEDERFEIDMDMTEDEKPEQKPAQGLPEGLDQETLALAMALKKIKEDPSVRSVFEAALGHDRQPQQAQPAVDPREQELNQKKQRLAELEAQYAQLPEDDPRRAQLAVEIVTLRTEIASLEPLIAVERRVKPIEQTLLHTRMNELYLFAQNLLMGDRRYDRLTAEQKQMILQNIRAGLERMLRENPAGLQDPNATMYLEQLINSYAFQFMVPQPPHDPGVNQPQQGASSQIPPEILEEAKRDGVDIEMLKKIYMEANNG